MKRVNRKGLPGTGGRVLACLIPALATGVIGAPHLRAQAWEATSVTREVSVQYLETTFAQKYDELMNLYAPDVAFIDPTGDIFGPDSRAAAGVHGSADLVELQKSWGILASDFRVDTHIFVGEYGVFEGTLKVTLAGEDDESASFDLPFVTVIGVSNGRVAARTDYGDYRSMVATDVSAATALTDSVARVYLTAYAEQRHADMAAMSSPDVTFQDPTARVFRAELGRPVHGLEAVQANFEQAFQPIDAFDVAVERAIVVNHHAIFVGRVTYSIPGEVFGSSTDTIQFDHPAIIVVTVENGKVTAHRDYVDYSYFPEQLSEQR